MSAPEEDQSTASAAEHEPGVLSNLPRTRPQRSSPRRAAARKAGAAQSANGGAPAPTKARPKQKRRAPAGAPPRRRAAAAAAGEAVPRQGFESTEERLAGPVSPPGGAELLAAAVEVVNELAKAGVSTGERVLRDVFSRLPH